MRALNWSLSSFVALLLGCQPSGGEEASAASATASAVTTSSETEEEGESSGESTTGPSTTTSASSGDGDGDGDGDDGCDASAMVLFAACEVAYGQAEDHCLAGCDFDSSGDPVDACVYGACYHGCHVDALQAFDGCVLELSCEGGPLRGACIETCSVEAALCFQNAADDDQCFVGTDTVCADLFSICIDECA